MASSTEADKFEVLEKIGHGSFGVIRKVKRKTDGKILCRKEINYLRMSQREREQLHSELSILSSLRHPNIVAYYHRDHLKLSQELHLYMEYCGGGDLSNYIRGLISKKQHAPEEFVWSVFAQLVTALYRCHYGQNPPEVGTNVMGPVATKPEGLRPKNQVMILHRDLKPENVFLGEDNAVKLGDFGLSKLMRSHDFASTYVGTPYYMSPEICAAEKYTLQSDIWSLGCIVYEMCAKKPPFDAKTHFHLVQKIKEGKYEPLEAIYSVELQTVVQSCLKTNPKTRPDTKQLLNLPIVRLLRKEREVVEFGKSLKAKEEEMLHKVKEAEALIASLDKDKDQARVEFRHEIEEVVRREWEVRARLEIDRQIAEGVEAEKERLQKIFDTEVPRRVEAEVSRRVSAGSSNHEASTQASSVPVPALSSISTATSAESPSTDMTSLSLESPDMARGPPMKKRSTRTPFSRAKTGVDSPMDVHMASPSPMSIASLSLSPRRAAALARGFPVPNVFLGNMQGAQFQTRRQPQTMLALNSDDESDADADEDTMPEIPSPTRQPRATAGAASAAAMDPFNKRPRMGLRRQTTLPTNRYVSQPSLFTRGEVHNDAAKKRDRSPVPMRQPQQTLSPRRRPESPTRARGSRPPRPTSAIIKGVVTSAAHTLGGEEMLKAVTQKNMLGAGSGNNNSSGGGGKTLVELNQARSAAAAASTQHEGQEGDKPVSLGQVPELEKPAIWDPDREMEMPSPFLVRGKKPVVWR